MFKAMFILTSTLNIYNNNIDVKSYTLDDRWYQSMLSVICYLLGLLLHMHEANFLTILKPNYEKPNDTAGDVLDRDLTLLQ